MVEFHAALELRGRAGVVLLADGGAEILIVEQLFRRGDGLRHHEQGHPRAAGAFPRFIAEYIRTGKVGLTEGIAKMTCCSAERLRLPKKGNLKPGSDADVVIFDYDRIRDTATFEEPALVPEGIAYVLLGGEIAAKDGEVVNAHLGKAVRYEG